MAMGFAISSKGGEYNGTITLFVIISCMVAAMGGFIFGYDIGVSGGVTSMEPFLKQFFSKVYTRMKEDTKISNYCKFDSQLLTLFTSSLYLAGLMASFFASFVTDVFGRKTSMLAGGTAFLVGAALNGAAVNIYMLIFGRVLLGVGVGFTNQAVPLYLSEMALPKYRGAISNGFQFTIGIGFLAANLVNYGTEKITGGWGWRISLAMAAVPASVLTLGALLLPETPNSLIQRSNDYEKAKQILQKLRGTDDVQEELNDLIKASDIPKTMKNPYKSILQRNYCPQFVMSIAIPFFQIVTGINVIGFYSPILFRTIGLGESASLLSSVFTGVVGSTTTLIAMLVVDRVGRRPLLIIGGIVMLVSQMIVGGILAAKLGDHNGLRKGYAYVVLMMICIYVAGFGLSWGPLGWLIPSEIFPLEIRSAGQSITVAVNFLFTFIVGQTFLSMLCHFKSGLFFFFGGWVALMTGFVFLLLPETKNLPIEQMDRIWKDHWFWKKIVANNQKVVCKWMKLTLNLSLSYMKSSCISRNCMCYYTTGGVTSMEPFLKKFFPEVYTKMKEDSNISNYCKFDSQLLTSFTSSLYVAGFIASFFASPVTRIFGRKPSILIGGAAFLVGSALGGSAYNIYMLIVGRVLLGVGLGFTNQAVPLYLSEMALPKYRGAFNIFFQICVNIGYIMATLINYGTVRIKGGWGWRISLAMAGAPAAILTLGALFLPETPNSLMQHSNDQENAKLMLQKVRGTRDVQTELDDLIKASHASKQIKHPFKNLMKRKYRPQLVMSILIPFFQQITGINVIAFYAPILFLTIGSGENASLMSAILTGLVGLTSTLLSSFLVDKLGRRSLFHFGGIQMFISQILIGGIMAAKLGDHGGLSKGYGIFVLILICIYVAGFGISWGPLGWVVTSEIFPLEIRSAAQSIVVAINLFFTFAIAQVFLAMLCHMKSGIFFFFGGWVLLMTAFVYFFLPETKNIPIEKMDQIWGQHSFWKRIVVDSINEGA